MATRTALAQPFDCLEKYCADMVNCAEAHHKLKVCGHSKRDGDNDGIPCENVCGKTLESYAERLGFDPIITPVAIDAPQSAKPAGPKRGTPQLARTNPGFTCGSKRTCRQMTSCAEARFHLQTCGLTRLDGDRDGVPCNALCRGVR